MSYKINIPKPCNESWDKMEPTQDGRYCSVCKKIIYDFTTLSNQELVAKIEGNKNLCARYKQSQLNTDLYSNKRRKSIQLAVMITIASTSLITQSIEAQTIKNEKTEQISVTLENNKKNNTETKKKNEKRDTIKISGVIKNNEEPMTGVNVFQKGRKIGTITNKKGEFSLNIVDTIPTTLVINCIGYKQKEIIINDLNIRLDIKLDESETMLMGEVVVVKQNIFKRIINSIKRKK